MDMKFEEFVIQCGRVIVMNDLKQSSWFDGYALCIKDLQWDELKVYQQRIVWYIRETNF